MGVVRRAVQRIDDPSPPGPAGGGAAFLVEDGVTGKRRRQAADDQLLDASVHLGHQVRRAALVGDSARSGELALQELPGGPCGVDRHASFSDAMLRRNVSYVSCTSWGWAPAVSTGTSGLAAKLRPGNVDSADGWNHVLLSSSRYHRRTRPS